MAAKVQISRMPKHRKHHDSGGLDSSIPYLWLSGLAYNTHQWGFQG